MGLLLTSSLNDDHICGPKLLAAPGPYTGKQMLSVFSVSRCAYHMHERSLNKPVGFGSPWYVLQLQTASRGTGEGPEVQSEE